MLNHGYVLTLIITDQVRSTEVLPTWEIIISLIILLGSGLILYWMNETRVKAREKVLSKKVELRTQEIQQQKEILEKKSQELEKAYLEIQTKNQAIEEAFQHLSDSFEKMSDLNREKDGMMSVVAHDLRTPLNNIEGLIQLVKLDGTLNPEQEEYISKITQIVKRGNEMIRDLLDINKAQNKGIALDLSKFSLSEYIQDWKSNFEKQLLEKEQTLVLTGNFDNKFFRTDTGMLSRVLDNLMSNAIKFSKPCTSIYLDIQSSNGQLDIALKDEGLGISENDQKKMFKPFTKLSARPTSGEPSNGLGLSIIKALIQNLKGTLKVASELEKGTTFNICIPYIEPEETKT